MSKDAYSKDAPHKGKVILARILAEIAAEKVAIREREEARLREQEARLREERRALYDRRDKTTVPTREGHSKSESTVQALLAQARKDDAARDRVAQGLPAFLVRFEPESIDQALSTPPVRAMPPPPKSEPMFSWDLGDTFGIGDPRVRRALDEWEQHQARWGGWW